MLICKLSKVFLLRFLVCPATTMCLLTKKNASHGFRPAYCGTLESALKMLFDQLVIANIDENGSYGKKFADLRKIIIQTKKELQQLVSLDVRELICEGE